MVSDRPPSTEPVEPDILARWLGITALIASAEQMAARGAGAWPGLALATADTAIEGILGLVASPGPEPPGPDAGFPQIYSSAIRALDEEGVKVSQSLRTRIQSTHRARNAALHLGTEPPASAVRRAIVTAHEMRDLAVSRSAMLQAFRAGGPAMAVANHVGIEPIKTPLLQADEALRAGRFEQAADNASMALDETLKRLTPPLRAGSFLAGRQAHRELFDILEPMHARSARLEAWVLALATGLRPIELRRLQEILGEPQWSVATDTPRVVRENEDGLTQEALERAILQTADLIFRLWQSDSLYAGESWWDQRD